MPKEWHTEYHQYQIRTQKPDDVLTLCEYTREVQVTMKKAKESLKLDRDLHCTFSTKQKFSHLNRPSGTSKPKPEKVKFLLNGASDSSSSEEWEEAEYFEK